MSTTTRTIRKHYAGDNPSHDYAAVTLPAIPGVQVDGDRSETAPKQPVIRSARVRRPLAGIALTAAAARRVEMFRQALIEATQEIEE